MSNDKTLEVLQSYIDATDEEILLANASRIHRYKRLRQEIEQGKPSSSSSSSSSTAAAAAATTTEKRRKKTMTKKEFYMKKLLGNQIVENVSSSISSKAKDAPSYLPVDTQLKKVTNMGDLKLALNNLEVYKPKSYKEEIIKRMYLDILRLHNEKHAAFSAPTVSLYSEQDYQFKFWSYLFETYFGRHQSVHLTWGKATSPTCERSNPKFNMDLRFLVTPNDQTLHDVGVAEVARSAIQSKYFKDKAKTVITSKCYLNSLLKVMPYLDWRKIPSIRVPFIHIMGFDAVIYTLSVKNKKTYTIEKLATMSYPRTLDHIKGGHIQMILEAFTLLENTILELERFYNESQSSSDGNTIDEMLAETPKKNKLDINKWITELVWTKEDNGVVGAGRGEVEEGQEEDSTEDA